MKDRPILPLLAAILMILCLTAQKIPAREYQPVETPTFKYLGKPKRRAAQTVETERPAPVKKTRSAVERPARAASEKAAPVSVASAPPATAASESEGAQTAQGFPLFGTVGFKRPLEKAPAWADAINRNLADIIFQPDRYFNKKTNWQKFKAEAEKLDDKGKLDKVNAFFNSFPYISDMKNWGKNDYWAIPAQFLKKSGDCEDYAIIKYFTLRELGFPAENMRIVIVMDTVLNEGHAVLAVKTGGKTYILDNQSRVVLPQERIHNYEPHYSVNELGRWNQMKPMTGKN